MKKAIASSLGLVLAVTLCLAATQNTFAQGRGGNRGRRGDQGMRREGQGQWDPSRMREMMAERLKTVLDCTDEEWEVIGPRVEKVVELRMSGAMRGGMRMMRGGRGGRGGEAGGPPPGGEPGNEMPEADALRTALDGEDASTEVITEKLQAYRKAVASKEAELQTARDELREVLSVRQEAQLVLMGLLD